MAWLDTLLLRCSSPRMRQRAVDNLSKSTRLSDTELLCATLQDPDRQVRCAAVRALAKKNTPESRQSLAGALKDSAFEVRAAAAEALGQSAQHNAAGALVGCLSDADVSVRVAAASALRALGWKASSHQELALFEIALGNTPAVQNQNHADRFDTAHNQDTAFYRRLAAIAKEEKTDPARIRALLAEVAGTDLLRRLSAIHDLSEVDDPDVTQSLLGLLRAPEAQIRLAAAQAISRRHDSAPVHFVGLLQDPSSEVRLVAIEFLSRVRHKHIVQVLTPLLGDTNSLVREAAATAVRQIRTPSERLLAGA